METIVDKLNGEDDEALEALRELRCMGRIGRGGAE